jgi:RNA polymerase sigma-70 factor (ECF subfamily)
VGGVENFDDLAGRYRRELHVHCYRMLGSFDEAEDHVQEVLLRAWRARENFQGQSSPHTAFEQPSMFPAFGLPARL